MLGAVMPAAGGPTDALELTCIERGDVVIVHAAGELDATTCHRLRRLLANLLRQPVNRIELDLSGIAFMDSSGLGALLAHRVAAERVSVDLRVVAPSRQVARVLDLTGTERRLLSV
jgi:anti-anti-sigma factor